MQKRLAFTLIELLVVISIISILMATLLPALQRARQTAVVAQCQSNIRGMTIAMTNYTFDNNGWFPGQEAPNVVDYDFWRFAIPSYIGLDGTSSSHPYWYKTNALRQVVCPSLVSGTLTNGFPHWMFAMNWGLLTTYKDTPTSAPNTGSANAAKLRISARYDLIRSPSDKFMMVDGGYQTAAITPTLYIINYGIVGNTAGSPNHDGRGNSMSFLDGHASYEATDRPFVYDPRAKWNLKSAWLENSQGYLFAIAD